MREFWLTDGNVTAFLRHLEVEERSRGTREKYLRDIRAFRLWLADRPVTKDHMAGWKGELLERGYCPATINSMLTSVNMLLRWLGLEDCCVRTLKLQRRVFRDPARELTREDYVRLRCAAHARGKERLALLIESICATGMRVSEVRYLTAEALRRGQVQIHLKGKVRVILLPKKLRRKLLDYVKKIHLTSGEVFRTRTGKPLGRKQIWAEMKSLCDEAKVDKSKVFPHNLRHLFAREFYKTCGDVVKLADVLGHSSIDTTRIYLLSTGREHIRQLERLRLVL